MGQGYQDRDWEIIDYELYQSEGFGRPFRGPNPGGLTAGRYFTCIGAAQTFGCYAEHPFPSLLSAELDMPVVNMGVAGAGPSFFLRRDNFIRLANQSAFVVMQLMSARSVSNSLLESEGGEMLTDRKTGERLGAAPMYQKMMQSLPPEVLQALIRETQENWVTETQQLLRALTAPVVLLWFSSRQPDYQPDDDSVHSLFGEFPQLVQGWMVDAVSNGMDRYIPVVSSDGLPQELVSRFSGQPASINKRADLEGSSKARNDYYPSPEMHELAFKQLLPTCRDLVASS
jgi:hypothetical protein